MRGLWTHVPFRTPFPRRLPQTRVVARPSPATVAVLAPQPFATQSGATRVLDLKRPLSPLVRGLRRALDAVVDVGALLLIVWLIPFVVLAIVGPIVLILWAVLALLHRL